MQRTASLGVIGVSERNPHYFQYKGKEILLITSAEHYGSVISGKFDYIKYFDRLAEYGLNYTRVYPGAIVEPPGFWLVEDTMTPSPDELIVPWARSNVPGYFGGGNKFDLDTWDEAYFARLRDYMAQAGKRGIIVEICFFNCQNKPYWQYSPLNVNANIQGVGDCDHITFQTLDNGPLVREQLKYIEKIVAETNEFDNVIYEFVDEPTLMMTPSRKAYLWIDKMIDAVVALEEKLPKRHMLTQQLEIGVDFCDDERISFIVTQYISANSRQIGGQAALQSCYCYNKPIEMNETAYVPSWYDRDHEAISRLEAWEFMVGGGASFNQLNGYFVSSNPSGDNENNIKILAGLRNLRAFMEGLDFVNMARDTRTVLATSIGAHVSMISQKGRQYAMYIHHSYLNLGRFYGSFYDPRYGEYETELTLALEDGEYDVTFVEPATLNIIGSTKITSAKGEAKLACPRYALDIAIKIARVR
ncbi:MAG: hypothetical protein FWH01_17570 [Oscillospiraceae bacterium]|nr:hypothetical protein [Oscillospiraceae bacterium]